MIRYVAFKLFLERGYEATNIRDICKEVNIKASSLYFYYNSKQELFFSIYEEIWRKKIEYLSSIEELKQSIPSNLKFYSLYIRTLEYYEQNIANMKFLLRYHLFPPEEISKSIREKFKLWTNEENKISTCIINECLEKKILDSSRLQDNYLKEYRKLENSLLSEMIIYNIKMSSEELDMVWSRFWNCTMLNCLQ